MKPRPRPSPSWFPMLLTCMVFPAFPIAAGAAADHSSVESTVQVVAGATGLTAAALIRADPETQSRVNGWVDRLRTGWTPNRGQIADASGHPAGNVLFTTTVGDAQIYVTTTGIS